MDFDEGAPICDTTLDQSRIWGGMDIVGYIHPVRTQQSWYVWSYVKEDHQQSGSNGDLESSTIMN
jgi:hypothetical protein